MTEHVFERPNVTVRNKFNTSKMKQKMNTSWIQSQLPGYGGKLT